MFLTTSGIIFFSIFSALEAKNVANITGITEEECQGRIECRNIYFRYPARPNVPVLEDFSLHIPPGKTTALVGASGSGKSTIVSLLERYYDVNQGQVLLDGHDIRNLNITWLRTQIGYVAQEPALFSTTIRQNIEYGLFNTKWENVSQEEKQKLVEEAACVSYVALLTEIA